MDLQPNGNPLPLSIDGTFGAVLIANILSAMFFGILTVQTYLYFLRFPNDPKWIKCLVATVWILDLAHSVSTSAFSYIYVVGLFGQPQNIGLSSKVVGVCLQLEPPTGLLVQLYFARRHWVLNGRKWLFSGTIAVVAFVSFGFGMGAGGTAYVLPRFVDYKDSTYLVTVWLVGSALVDILITISVAWTLWTSKTGFRQTDRFITKVIVWTVNTGLLTSVTALLDIIFFVTADTTLIHLAFNFILAKLYSNTLLASLARRRAVMEDMAAPQQWSNNFKMGHVTSASYEHRIPGIASRHTTKLSAQDEVVRVEMTTSRANFVDMGDTIDIRAIQSSPTYFDGLTAGERRAHGYI